jgi:hypothetical protein
MMLHALGFLWFFGGFRGNWVFLIGFVIFALLVRIALRNVFGRGALRGPRYNKYNENNKYGGSKPTQGDNQSGQPTQNPYYGAPDSHPNSYNGGSGTGAETVRTDSGVETRRVDTAEGAIARIYGEPTRPLESGTEATSNRAGMDDELNDAAGDQS